MDGRPPGASRRRPGSPAASLRHSPRDPTPPPRSPSPLDRCIFVTNHLPLKCSKDEASGWNFEWDPDALVAQAKEGLPDDMEAVYVGCLPVEIEGHEHEVGAAAYAGRVWGGSGGGRASREVVSPRAQRWLTERAPPARTRCLPTVRSSSLVGCCRR